MICDASIREPKLCDFARGMCFQNQPEWVTDQLAIEKRYSPQSWSCFNCLVFNKLYIQYNYRYMIHDYLLLL